MDRLAAWFGQGECERRVERARRFWSGEGRFVVSVNAGEGQYRQVFDEAEIRRLAPLNLKAQAALPGLNVPAFFADFGTISTAKYWGGRARFDSTGGNIFLDPVAESSAAALALSPASLDDPSQDAARALSLYRAVCEELGTHALWMRTPDMQGPLNTAAMIVNQENFLVEMYTEPDTVRRLLERVTAFLVDYARYFHAQTQGRVCGYIWPYTFFPCDIGLAVTEDMMPLLSPEAYREFGIPCLQTLDREFGGLQIHCCGEWGRHAGNLASAGLRLRAVEFHYPFTRIEELAPLAPNTVFVPYISLDKQRDFGSITEYYRHLLASTGLDHRYWFAFYGDDEEARRFATDMSDASPWSAGRGT